jgi:hypothetical protein
MTPEEKTQKVLTEQREAYIKSSDELMKTYNAYDKTVLTLSTGAIGICLLLLKDLPNHTNITLLVIATLSYVLSLMSILCSYFFGIRAFKRDMASYAVSIERVSNAIEGKVLPASEVKPVRHLQILTDTCNFISGAAFLIGTLLIALFIINLYT